MKNYVSIDIGGTCIKYGIIDETGSILVKQEMDTEAFQGGPSILEKAVGIVRGFHTEYAPAGICISTAGMVDTEEGEIFYAAPLIPNYTGTKFKKTMEEIFSIPCEVENDVNCAGLAESVSGAAKGSKTALCLTVGTGIGGCIVIDGKVFAGYANSACEIGYMHLPGGDFQTLGATSSLLRKVEQAKGAEGWDGRRIFEEAKNGDEICLNAIGEMADVLGMGIANICYVLNPQTVVLGGGIMAQQAFLKPRIDNALHKYLIESVAKNTTLAFALHGNSAGMLGAFYHFKNRQG